MVRLLFQCDLEGLHRFLVVTSFRQQIAEQHARIGQFRLQPDRLFQDLVALLEFFQLHQSAREIGPGAKIFRRHFYGFAQLLHCKAVSPHFCRDAA